MNRRQLHHDVRWDEGPVLPRKVTGAQPSTRGPDPRGAVRRGHVRDAPGGPQKRGSSLGLDRLHPRSAPDQELALFNSVVRPVRDGLPKTLGIEASPGKLS